MISPDGRWVGLSPFFHPQHDRSSCKQGQRTSSSRACRSLPRLRHDSHPGITNCRLVQIFFRFRELLSFVIIVVCSKTRPVIEDCQFQISVWVKRKRPCEYYLCDILSHVKKKLYSRVTLYVNWFRLLDFCPIWLLRLSKSSYWK